MAIGRERCAEKVNKVGLWEVLESLVALAVRLPTK